MVTDVIQPFTFPELPVRGQLVRLETSWQSIVAGHGYPTAGAAILGEMVVIAAMLAHSIKLDGSVVLQTRGDGPLRTAMAECADRATLRGILRFSDPAPETLPANPMGTGQLAITLQPQRGAPYQGRVDLSMGPFSTSVERYFDQSEQLPTRIRVATTPTHAVGLLVQRLPSESEDAAPESWHRVADRTAQVRDELLLQAPTETLLKQTYAREVIALSPTRELAFGCSCSQDRASGALRAMGRSEVEALIASRTRIEVSCEFCGARYDYDAIDARLLFEAAPQANPDDPVH